ncbi:MAG: NAD(P)-dependent oxidoreductase [Hungatella sp.]|nr:NAD(P)-dependent oxidoreductase [Hungatella sp.]
MKKKILKKLIKAYENNHQYNLKHGIVPTDVLIEEVLISDLACIFAKKYGCDGDFLKEFLYRYLNGTAPSRVYNKKIFPYYEPHNRLHNWLCRSMKDPALIFHNQLLPADCIRGILNGDKALTLENLYYTVAAPYGLDKKEFQYLTYEVMEDYDDEKIGKIYSSIKNGKEKPHAFHKEPEQKAERERTILITGASGFIARSLLATLKNCRLILLYHKMPSPHDMELIPDGSILYIGDVRNEILIKRIVLENQIDIIYWMAGMTTRSQCSNPVGTYFHNCHPLHVIYQLMDEKAARIKGIILPSTCLLEPFDHYSVKELAGKLNGETLCDQYAASKLLMELEAVYFCANSKFPVVITRLSQVYGNDPDSDRLIPVSVKKAKQGEDLICVVNKAGHSQQIAPIHVLDVANALSLLCDKIMSDDYDFRSGRYLNITGPQVLTVEEILIKIADMSQKKIGITKLVKEDLTVESLNFLIDEAWKRIGFMPSITIDEGLREIITL